MSTWKSWAYAFVVAAGAFWLIMAQNPPTSVAADPSEPFSTLNIRAPSDLPVADGGNAY